MAHLFEGSGLLGRVVNPELGLAGGKPKVRWDMEVTEGPHAGKRAQYSGKFDPDNIKWTKRDMIRVGWQGKDVRTFVEDVKKAAKIVPFDAEIASNTYQDSGKTSQWTAVRFGGGGKPLEAPDADKVNQMNAWFAEVQDEAEEKIPF